MPGEARRIPLSGWLSDNSENIEVSRVVLGESIGKRKTLETRAISGAAGLPHGHFHSRRELLFLEGSVLVRAPPDVVQVI